MLKLEQRGETGHVTIVLSDKSSCICSQSKAISLNNLELFDLYFGFLPFSTINR
ncbi:hypothetical protein [uncultured Gammaproteobacteria bacterium]|uniref:Uncharacterized protein n=1 Tax=Bathymodiolus azoricus thioautotrophic gill symbiont TaxID=235205 RepID=A0ACA8ZMS1_9GAMM|nr:hypothetical protein AZO1586R_132 [Bathymodiolus azoricus thioautotrophic gill symbiont]CAC9524910.1 hypothetical protein [uncultured Gammaproteobacteria bacterium]CAC9533361.1 hypothetical protein [uncultured Gammaproteobacteria bacterium]